MRRYLLKRVPISSSSLSESRIDSSTASMFEFEFDQEGNADWLELAGGQGTCSVEPWRGSPAENEAWTLKFWKLTHLDTFEKHVTDTAACRRVAELLMGWQARITISHLQPGLTLLSSQGTFLHGQVGVGGTASSDPRSSRDSSEMAMGKSTEGDGTSGL